MPTVTRSELAAYALCAIVVALLGVRALRTPAPEAGPASGVPGEVASGRGGGSGASSGGGASAADGGAHGEAPGDGASAGGGGSGGGASSADGGTGGEGSGDDASSGGGVPVERDAGDPVVVHVVGAVRRPGLYRLPAGARVADAVERAGGATARADLAGLNLASKPADGQQVVVPRRGQAPAAAPAPATAAAPTAGGSAAPAAVLDLNTATQAELETLDGVGPATAQKILAFRQERGGFRSVDELAQVPGIGPKRMAAIKPRVRV